MIDLNCLLDDACSVFGTGSIQTSNSLTKSEDYSEVRFFFKEKILEAEMEMADSDILSIINIYLTESDTESDVFSEKSDKNCKSLTKEPDEDMTAPEVLEWEVTADTRNSTCECISQEYQWVDPSCVSSTDHEIISIDTFRITQGSDFTKNVHLDNYSVRSMCSVSTFPNSFVSYGTMPLSCMRMDHITADSNMNNIEFIMEEYIPNKCSLLKGEKIDHLTHTQGFRTKIHNKVDSVLLRSDSDSECAYNYRLKPQYHSATSTFGDSFKGIYRTPSLNLQERICCNACSTIKLPKKWELRLSNLPSPVTSSIQSDMESCDPMGVDKTQMALKPNQTGKCSKNSSMGSSDKNSFIIKKHTGLKYKLRKVFTKQKSEHLHHQQQQQQQQQQHQYNLKKIL